jgi:type IV pilus assembly protein PilW
MPIPRRTPPRADAGIGIIELMIALTISALILAAVYSTFFRTQRATTTVMGKVEGRQGARAAVQLIERDLRMAGSGWGRMQVDGVYSNSLLTLRGVNPGFGTGGQDSIYAIGGWDVNTTLRAPMITQALVIQCVSTAGFSANDLVVVTNGTSAHLFQVTSVPSSPSDLYHTTASPFNNGARNNWPVGGYAAGARVFKVGWVTYRVDSTSYARPSLVRQEFGRTPMLVAYDIETFRTWYRMADGTTTRNPINLPMIEEVVPVLRTRNVSGKASDADSIWAVIRPRTF